jgi:hypothetical protein
MMIPPDVSGEPELIEVRSAASSGGGSLEKDTGASNAEPIKPEPVAAEAQFSPEPEPHTSTMQQPTIPGSVAERIGSDELATMLPVNSASQTPDLVEQAHPHARDGVRRNDRPAALTPPVEPIESFVGKWAGHRSACSSKNKKTAYIPLTLSERGAKAGGASCMFHKLARHGRTWNIEAKCRNSVESWDSQVRLVLAGPKLTWSSRRGTETYMRCS